MKSRFERHPVLSSFAGALVLVAAFLAADTGAYFAVTLFTAARDRISEWREPNRIRPASAQTSNVVFHHGLKENWTSHNESGPVAYDELTNSLGFRDERVRTVPLKASGHRVILIGDSFTEGVGLTFGSTFAGMLSRRLAATNTEVLNAAASSYSPIIYLRKLKYWIGEQGLVADEVIVFLDLSDIQDETFYEWSPEGDVKSHLTRSWVRYYLSMHGEPYWLNAALQRTYVSRILFGIAQRASLPRDLPNRLALNSPRALWTVDPLYYDGYAKEGLPLAQQHMDELKAFLDSRSIAMKLVVYPWPDQVYRHDLPSKQETIWKAWAVAHDVPFLDLFPDFIAKEPARVALAKYFIPDDIHFSMAGHRLVADRVMAEFYPVTPTAVPSADPRASRDAPAGGRRATPPR